MTTKEYAYAAIDKVIDLAMEQGIKYRRGDFYIEEFEAFTAQKQKVGFIGGATNPSGILVILWYNFERTAKKLKSVKDNFLSYKYCRVMPSGIFFSFSLNEIETIKAKKNGAEHSENEIKKVISRIQKLLALSGDKAASENEAIGASMHAQRLLAKYNLDIVDVTGKEKKEDIEQVIADVGTGKKWKYNLAEAVAHSYCCKCYYLGSEQVVFYGYQSDSLIARRVYVYLFKVGDGLAKKYVKTARERGEDTKGLYNSFCDGFTHGVKSELDKNCKALALVTPEEVKKSFEVFSAGFGEINASINTTDWDAWGEGETEGRRALNAQYIEA